MARRRRPRDPSEPKPRAPLSIRLDPEKEDELDEVTRRFAALLVAVGEDLDFTRADAARMLLDIGLERLGAWLDAIETKARAKGVL